MNMPLGTPADVAVILVAGVGERLRPLTNDRPKCLVDVGQGTLLGRTVALLVAHGVQEIVLATGYREDAVRAAMQGCAVPVRYCLNVAYATTQNGMSLLECEAAVGGRSFYKLDGDLLFRREVLERLDGCAAPLAVALERKAELGAEEMKATYVPGSQRIAAFGKGLEPKEAAGESIGLERVSGVAVLPLFHALEAARAAEETHLYYEDVYGRMVAGGLWAEGVEVSDLAWTEVDTPEDLDRAREMVRAGLV